jgi:hypothetical protein
METTMAHVSQPDSEHGITRALAHAIDMNKDGKLDAKEFEEFHRYLVGLAMEHQTMEQHVAGREDGTFDRAEKFAGHADDVDVYDGQKKREAIMTKVAADFATHLWQEGFIEDDVYAEEMQKLGMIPENVTKAREAAWDKSGPEAADLPAGDVAMAAWDHANGAGALPGPEESDDNNSMELDQEFIDEFKKRAKSGRTIKEA